MKAGHGGTAWQLLPLQGTMLDFWVSKLMALVRVGSPVLWGPWLSRVIARKGTALCCLLALMMTNTKASVNK